MKQRACSLLGGILLAYIATSSQAPAGPLEDGKAAYERGDYTAALQLWRPLADRGNASAQNAVGDLYATHKALVPRKGDDQDGEAAKWYRKAAEQGFAPAQSNLGRLYYMGWGVRRDLVEAAKWRRKAAEQGYAEAQVWLGNNYRDGAGVPQDYVLAYLWFDLADASPIGKGYDAAGSRDRLAAKMTPERIAEAQRLARTKAEMINERLRLPPGEQRQTQPTD